MIGGAEADVGRAMPILNVLGRHPVHFGPVGSGQIAKAANQLVVGVTIQAVAEAIAFATAAGVDAARSVAPCWGDSLRAGCSRFMGSGCLTGTSPRVPGTAACQGCAYHRAYSGRSKRSDAHI